MKSNSHDEARRLIVLGDDLADTQRAWLQTHLQECADCREYAEAAGRTVRAVRSQPLAADSSLVRITQMRVRSRALELRQHQERMWLVRTACALVGLSAAISTPLFWRAFAWMGEWAGASSWAWQSGFAFFWIVPALVVSAFLLARGTHWTHNGQTQ